MMSSWWILWTLFLFLLLVPAMGYGWAYRGWGPPYPTYVQRRRTLRASEAGGSATFDHQAWGWGGDFVWMVLAVAVLWAAIGLFWR